MSRDQKPGKFKLVGGTAPNYGRRAGDIVAGGPVVAAGTSAVVVDQADEGSGKGGLLLPLLFLAFCAVGGAGAVFFGLVGSLAR